MALWTLVVVDSWQWTPFVFVIVYARLQALPQEVFEAGSVDGASWFQRTLYLTLPLLMPAIVFAAVFRAIDAFRTFDLVYGLTNGGPGAVDHDAVLPGVPERLRVLALRLCVGDLLRDGARRRDRRPRCCFKVVKVRRVETA